MQKTHQKMQELHHRLGLIIISFRSVSILNYVAYEHNQVVMEQLHKEAQVINELAAEIEGLRFSIDTAKLWQPGTIQLQGRPLLAKLSSYPILSDIFLLRQQLESHLQSQGIDCRNELAPPSFVERKLVHEGVSGRRRFWLMVVLLVLLWNLVSLLFLRYLEIL